MYRKTIGLWIVLTFFVAPWLPIAGTAQDNKRQRDDSESDIFVATFGEPEETPTVGEETESETPATPSEQFKALMQEFNETQRESSTALRQAKTDEQRRELLSSAPRPDEFATRFLALAEGNADDPAALDALVWIVQYASQSPSGKKAMDILIDRHVTSDKLAVICSTLASSSSPNAEIQLRAVLEKSPHRQVKQKACFGLADLLNRQYSRARTVQRASDDVAARLNGLYGKAEVQRLQQVDTEELAAEIERLYMRSVEEFGDFDSLVGVVHSGKTGPSTDKAVEILVSEHLDNKQLGATLARLARSGSSSPAVEKLMHAIMEKGGQAQVKGQACFYLAQLIKDQSQMVGRLKNADQGLLEQYREHYGAATVDRLLGRDEEQLLDEAAKMFERVIREYAAVSSSRGKTLGEMAEPELFEIRYLSVGKEAPDIEAEDLDGEVFRLSDYRSKVVMLDFWGHW